MERLKNSIIGLGISLGVLAASPEIAEANKCRDTVMDTIKYNKRTAIYTKADGLMCDDGNGNESIKDPVALCIETSSDQHHLHHIATESGNPVHRKLALQNPNIGFMTLTQVTLEDPQVSLRRLAFELILCFDPKNLRPGRLQEFFETIVAESIDLDLRTKAAKQLSPTSRMELLEQTGQHGFSAELREALGGGENNLAIVLNESRSSAKRRAAFAKLSTAELQQIPMGFNRDQLEHTTLELVLKSLSSITDTESQVMLAINHKEPRVRAKVMTMIPDTEQSLFKDASDIKIEKSAMVRLAALQRFGKGGSVTDEDVDAHITNIINDKEEALELRVYVAQNLIPGSDFVLGHVQDNMLHSSIRAAAATRLGEEDKYQVAIDHLMPENVRVSATASMTDQAQLIEVIKEAGNQNVQMTAISKITDANALYDLSGQTHLIDPETMAFLQKRYRALKNL